MGEREAEMMFWFGSRGGLRWETSLLGPKFQRNRKILARFLWNESLDFQPALPRSALLSSLYILCDEVPRDARKDPLAERLNPPIINQAGTICAKPVFFGNRSKLKKIKISSKSGLVFKRVWGAAAPPQRWVQREDSSKGSS